MQAALYVYQKTSSLQVRIPPAVVFQIELYWLLIRLFFPLKHILIAFFIDFKITLPVDPL